MSKEGGGGKERISSTSAEGGRSSPVATSSEEQTRQGRPPHLSSQSAVTIQGEALAGGTQEEAPLRVPPVTHVDPVPSSQDVPRQVIAVSVSKGPSAFFNLARKFLVTDEMCDLSALEGAIVSAVDAAHLLERSKIANIIRVQTSYVTVEPKRRRQAKSTDTPSTTIEERSDTQGMGDFTMQPILYSMTETASTSTQSMEVTGRENQPPLDHLSVASAHSTERSVTRTKRTQQGGRGKGMSGALRRARIIITVKRTEDYKTWLQENPLQVTMEEVEDTVK